MFVMLVFGLLCLHVALVSSGIKVCHDPDKNSYYAYAYGLPGPAGAPGAPGTGGGVSSEVMAQISALNGKVESLIARLEIQRRAFTQLKGAAIAGQKIYISNGAQGTNSESSAMCYNSGGKVATPLNYAENNAVLYVQNQFADKSVFICEFLYPN